MFNGVLFLFNLFIGVAILLLRAKSVCTCGWIGLVWFCFVSFRFIGMSYLAHWLYISCFAIHLALRVCKWCTRYVIVMYDGRWTTDVCAILHLRIIHSFIVIHLMTLFSFLIINILSFIRTHIHGQIIYIIRYTFNTIPAGTCYLYRWTMNWAIKITKF